MIKMIQRASQQSKYQGVTEIELFNEVYNRISQKLASIRLDLETIIKEENDAAVSKGLPSNQEANTVPFFFSKALLDNIKQRQLLLQYHQAFMKGDRNLENLNMSKISHSDSNNEAYDNFEYDNDFQNNKLVVGESNFAFNTQKANHILM